MAMLFHWMWAVVHIEDAKAMWAAMAGDGRASHGLFDALEAFLLEHFIDRIHDFLGGGAIGDEDKLWVVIEIGLKHLFSVFDADLGHWATTLLAWLHRAI